MKIIQVADKLQYMDLLLLADEQENMIYKYLDKCTMYVLNDCGVKGEIAVCDVGNGVLEIKNIAVFPEYQRKGYGKALINFVCQKYAPDFSAVQVGTGDSPLTTPFYEKCGFFKSHVIADFFTDNYDHPIYECGVLLKDMIYLKKYL